jgi:hypothetical protein
MLRIRERAIMSKDRKPAREVNPCNATAMRKASRRLTVLEQENNALKQQLRMAPANKP